MNCDSCDYKRVDAYEWDDPISGELFETATYECENCDGKMRKANKVQPALTNYV